MESAVTTAFIRCRIAKERSKLLSEQLIRYGHYEAAERELDFNVIQEIVWEQFKTRLINKVYFVMQE